MLKYSKDAFRRRQVQWDAFHAWESTRQTAALSLEERVAWYVAASRFSRSFGGPITPENVAARVREIQRARERLAQLGVWGNG